MSRTSTILLLLVAHFTAFATNELFTIKGIVKDKQTDEPIPFAHVILDNIINVSNIDGEFIITTSDGDKKDAHIRVSYMGYNEYQKPAKELDSYHTIYLEPSVTHLEEVTVLTGSSIMDEVFDRFHTNYPMERQHMVGYYRESMGNWEETYYVAEGIMDIYTPSNIDRYNYPLVQPLRTRKKIFREVEAIDDVLGGNASDMAHSSIWRDDSFLSQKNRKHYDYFYEGTTRLGNHEVYIVDFEPGNSKGNTKGRLYIQEENNAILKIEYQPILDDYTYWEEVSWTEEYEQRNGLFEMVSVTFTGASTNHEYEYNALLVINESKSIEKLPESTALLGENDTFFDKAQEDFADSFWTGFNFMKLDADVAQLVSSSY